MPPILLRGRSLMRGPWRYLFWLSVAFILGRASHLLFPVFPQHPPIPISPEHIFSGSDDAVSELDPISTTVVTMSSAQLSLDALLAKQSTTLEEATARYYLKAGRPPPQNFDRWFEFARENECLIDEYDQIHRDFEPFYQLAVDHPTRFQAMIDKGRAMILNETEGLNRRQQEAIGLTAIRIINGTVEMPPYSGTAFAKDLSYGLRRFAHLLPDMEFLLNGRDEPRVVFNVRDPGARTRASKLEDLNPFHLAPYPTEDFFRNRSGCSLLSKAKGFAYDDTSNISFLRSSSSSDFTTDLWPLLSSTKISPCFSDILFPSQYFYRKSRWSPKLPPNNITWDERKPQLYWRGASNGGHIIGDNYHLFPRFRLVELGSKHPELLDVKMTGFPKGHCGKDCDSSRIVQEYGITLKNVPRKDILQYKYLLDIDGNTFSGRFLMWLKSGSLVFKLTAFEEYFNNWIRPYEHYIPVTDVDDLVEKVKWAISHESEARRIQEAGKMFTERIMTDEQNDCYFAAVLLEWARLQSYARTLHS
ncbi:CAP10 domain-containing protein [Favolaschia claudopus]|uniref:CAP10 domain-containing protein n=1 Tax=Favolaschia claudopus TaxID=2862362 RepID=A0AAW0DAQ0_9AGAR